MNKKLSRTNIIYFTVLLLFVGIRIASSLGMFSFMSSDIGNSYVATIIIQIVLMVLVPLLLCYLFFKQKPKEVFKSFRFKKISFKAIVISFLIGLILFLINLIVATFFSSLLQSLGYSHGTGSGTGYAYDSFIKFLGGVFFVAVLPGFCEEFLHRGLLMRNIGDETNYKFAILISAICFGLMHLNIEQFFYATILGIIIGFVGCCSDSIFPCMILHFTNNFMSVYLSYAQTNNLFGGNFYSKINSILSNNEPFFIFIFIAFVLMILIIALIFLILQLFKETKAKQLQQSLLKVQQAISGEDLENQSQQKVSTDFYSYIFPHIQKNENSLSFFLPAPKVNYKPTLADNIFLVASVFLGSVITIMTFVWGVI